MRSPDSYQILGISRQASRNDIREAYRRLAKLHHPDNGGDALHFGKIKAAYDVVIAAAPAKRSAEDKVYSGTSPGVIYVEAEGPYTGIERRMRAEGCLKCGGLGYKTHISKLKNGDIERREETCTCQYGQR